MLPTSHDGRAPGASSGEAQEEHASDDKSRDGIARALFRTTGRIQCEVCLRIKPEFQMADGFTYTATATVSDLWQSNNPVGCLAQMPRSAERINHVEMR